MNLTTWLTKVDDLRARLTRYQRARLWLAPLLSAAAVAVHFQLNVPDKVVHSPRDQGARGKKVKKKAAKKPRRPAHEPRTVAQLDELWTRYRSAPYDKEPRVPAWGRAMKPLLGQIVTRARKEAFRGAPETPQIQAQRFDCRTVRCSFLLSTEHPQETDLLVQTLRRASQGGRALWRDLRVEPAPPPDGAPNPEASYWRVTVGLSRDRITPAQVTFPEPRGEGSGGSPTSK